MEILCFFSEVGVSVLENLHPSLYRSLKKKSARSTTKTVYIPCCAASQDSKAISFATRVNNNGSKCIINQYAQPDSRPLKSFLCSLVIHLSTCAAGISKCLRACSVNVEPRRVIFVKHFHYSEWKSPREKPQNERTYNFLLKSVARAPVDIWPLVARFVKRNGAISRYIRCIHKSFLDTVQNFISLENHYSFNLRSSLTTSALNVLNLNIGYVD